MGIIQGIPRAFWVVALAAGVVGALLACTPTTSDSGGEGIDVGNTSPPFAMTLMDGSEVSLKNLVEENQAAHLFWFATW